MLTWRICRRAHQKLDGGGARLSGGRWNSEGVALVYSSSTLSLAALEFLVHVDIEDAPDDLVAMAIKVPDDASANVVALADLPRDWPKVPDHPACVAIGDTWVRPGAALLLRVPSAVIPEEGNVLINPRHPQSVEVVVQSVRPFAFDPRVL